MNIMMSGNRKCLKIVDFGFATGHDITVKGHKRAECGTRHFEAPEQY